MESAQTMTEKNKNTLGKRKKPDRDAVLTSDRDESLCNYDDWATRGGLVKTDWTQAPFSSSYRNYDATACVWSASACKSSCNDYTLKSQSGDGGGDGWLNEELDSSSEESLKWV
ncbi:xyloglucan endotransglucosylase protein 7-like [Impatiens glandulifera]|uniref:xyloglucan endotransglucosylase protein 7-like n=1 Tax=Impatiens glandulifera TaxID=253017 RepID=UPI001FB076F1|nr:xyloglucan endotransglucosylase protein 7-like [Impatiens glandulifera]